MTGSDLVRQLRAAPPRGPEEAVALASGIGAITADHALRLLDHLVKGGLDAVQVHAQGALFVHLVHQSGDRALFSTLVKALKSNDPALRAVLAQALPKVNDPAAHPELVDLLRNADPGIRASAGQVLAAVGGRTVLAMVDDLVKEPHFPGRGIAIDVAVRVAGHHAIPTLLEAFPRASQSEKLKILKYLGEERFMGRDRAGALRALAIGLVDENEAVVAAAVTAFSTLASEAEWFAYVAPMLDWPSLTIVRAALDGLRRFCSVQTIAALERKLNSGPQSIRLAVLDVIESLDTDAVLPLLVEALGHRQLAVRARAAEVLGHVGASGKVDVARTVMWLLHSRDAEVRRYAVEVARQVADPANQLWPRLVAHLRDEDWWVRERVADALVDLAGQKLVRYVIPLLDTGTAPVRMFAVGVIRRLRAVAAIGALVRTAQADTDWWVRECAIEAIGVLKDTRAAPHVAEIALKEPDFRLVALGALREMGARDMAPHVARVLGDEAPEVRLAALDCLERIGDNAQAIPVQRLLGDPHPAVAERARKLLLRWNVTASTRAVDDEEGSALDRLLLAMAGSGGDDLILVPGRPPYMKRLGRVEAIGEHVLAADDVRDLVVPLLSAQQTDDIDRRRDVDLSYRVESDGTRFRANIFRQIHGMSAVFRVVRGSIPTLEDLGLPPVVHGLGDLPNGLVLIGGPTGSGKSTTLAALIDRINRSSSRHVITFEDPIEVVHPRAKGLVNQRELGTHTGSFNAALRATLREDPDVILVGELRDLATISFAVSVAETGHLVLGTVHTVSVDTSLDRLINTFPAGSQDQVRAMLAGSLRGVVCQHLLPRADGKGRALAAEVMINNDAVANLIRKGKCYQLPSVIATSRDQGMQSMDAELMRFYNAGVITADTAYAKAHDKKQFEALAPPDSKKAGA